MSVSQILIWIQFRGPNGQLKATSEGFMVWPNLARRMEKVTTEAFIWPHNDAS